MKKILPVLLIALCGAACSDDKPSGKKENADSSTGVKDTVTDSLPQELIVPRALEIPRGISINTKIKNGDTVYIVNDSRALEDLFYYDEDWSRFPGVVDYDSAFAAQPQPDWKKIPVDTLLKEMFRHAEFSQMCEAEEPALPENFHYATIERNEFAIRGTGFQKLRNRRREVIDYYMKGKKSRYTIDDLCIFIDLNAVEMLPYLLDAERKLRTLALAAADKRLYHKEGIGEKEKNYMTYSVGKAYNYVLATICAILRQEKYEALLQSDMEAELKKQIETFAKENQPTKESKAAEADGYVYTYTDPVYNLITGVHVKTDAPVTKTNVERIASWADDYIRNKLPEAAKTAGERMTNRPVGR
ncbi:MAG: hypothetical protein FD123_2477 [Bacteroidetes bacterium]|nr:MAG: hypothetical protein FD123_2477 [Bacteroidota bacterium]